MLGFFSAAIKTLTQTFGFRFQFYLLAAVRFQSKSETAVISPFLELFCSANINKIPYIRKAH